MLISASPAYGLTQSIAATTSSGAATITLAKDTPQVLVTVDGSNLAFIRISASGTAATSAALPVLPGTQVIVNKPQDALICSAITATSTATVYFTPMFGT